MTGGIARMAASISADLVTRLPRQNKKQREGLALLAATMLDVRSANLMDLSASLPREAVRIDMRYQWISRLLGNEHIDVDEVMAPFAREVLARAAAGGQSILLIIDQTKANETQQAVVVAARVGGRSLPISWRVKETEGAIGFPEQKAALEAALKLLPAGVMDRLILVMTLALYWAVSTGMWAAEHAALPAKKKAPDAAPKKVARSVTSFFKRGLRHIQACVQRLWPLPTLWAVWKTDGW